MTAQSKPRYQQLKESIIAKISNGELRPSDRVPSEHELVDATGVSRMTANRALRELNHEGYVERVAGVGTFVADLKATSHALEVRNIADEIQLRGHQHSAAVLACESRPASSEIARLLHIELNAGIHHVLIVHCENELPIQIEDRYVNQGFAPDFLVQDFALVTPSAYLSSIAPLQEAEHVVRAALPIKDIRDHLQMNNGEPCLVVTRRTWAKGKPVSFARLHHPGDRFELTGHYVPPGTEKIIQQHADIVELRNIDQ
jgi:GntR family histidine utilization transcriptional repressor